jgi:hypothetical protein
MATIASESVHDEVDQLLLSGRAKTASEAEAMYLDNHLQEILQLAMELDDAALERHEAIKLLMFHGSRRLEDALS